jgi:hypothetical protein
MHPLLCAFRWSCRPHAAIDAARLGAAGVPPDARGRGDRAPVGHGDLKLGELARFAKRLANYRAVVLPNTFKSALIPWHAQSGTHGLSRRDALRAS